MEYQAGALSKSEIACCRQLDIKTLVVWLSDAPRKYSQSHYKLEMLGMSHQSQPSPSRPFRTPRSPQTND
jgi:hypothetical protein